MSLKGVVLVVDEDPTVASKLTAEVGPGDVAVRGVTSLGAAREVCRGPRLAAIVSEYGCGDGDVVGFCSWLRHHGGDNCGTPLLVLARQAGEAERVAALQAGADDFVAKPFNAREVLLRLRRWLPQRARPDLDPTTCQVGWAVLDLGARTLRAAGREVPLTPLEFEILRTLLQQRGAVCSRELLLEAVWGGDTQLNARAVDSHVRRLRRKLGRLRHLLETVRGFGYRIAGVR